MEKHGNAARLLLEESRNIILDRPAKKKNEEKEFEKDGRRTRYVRDRRRDDPDGPAFLQQGGPAAGTGPEPQEISRQETAEGKHGQTEKI